MIVVISGTNRPDSNSLKIAKLIVKKYEAIGSEAKLMNLQDLPLEIYDPSSYGEKPAAFEPFQEMILKSHGIHLVIPEYNGSFPGVLKYFIDMLKFPESFEGRCVAYTGVAAGIWGGIRACEQMQMVFGYRNGFTYPNRTFITAVHKKLDADGSINDEFLDNLMNQQIKGFKCFTETNYPNIAK